MKDPKLVGLNDPVAVARKLQTYGKLDRSDQYQDKSPAALLKSQNHQWVYIRELKSKISIQKLMLWILGGLVAAQWGVILVFVDKWLK